MGSDIYPYKTIHTIIFSVFTFVALVVLGHLYSVVRWEDPSGTSSHVVALVPVVLWLDLYKQRIVNLQLQLIIMSGDKPAQTDVAVISLIMG